MSIFHPSMIFVSDGEPSAKCFVRLMISDLCVASCGDDGLKRHSSASGTACVIRWWLLAMATAAMKMSSIKLSAMMSLGGRVMRRGSAFPNSVGVLESCGVESRKSKFDCRVVVSHVGSRARSQARSVALSLIILKSAGAGAEPNGNLVRR